jgi:cell division transport system ATP-binding protein
VIRLDHVTKIYPAGTRPAIEDVTIDIDKGEFVFLIGQSGSGKSTVLRLLLREELASSGKVFVDGRNVGRLRRRRIPELRRKIGCVFQDFRLLPKKNVYDNVAFALEVINKSQRTIRRSVPEVILLADEPTGNLDPDTSQGIMSLLERINRTGTTVLMATHDNNIVDAMRRRVIELDVGHIIRDQSRGVYGVGR